jgi:hypothetical protein
MVSALSAPLFAQAREGVEPQPKLRISTEALEVPVLGRMSPTKVGPFTFVESQLRGEFVRVSLPIGEYVMSLARGLASANRRRQEAAARRRVAAELSALESRK